MISSNSLKYVEEDDVDSPVHNDVESNPSMFSSSWASSISGPPISLGYGHGIMSHKDTVQSVFFECF